MESIEKKLQEEEDQSYLDKQDHKDRIIDEWASNLDYIKNIGRDSIDRVGSNALAQHAKAMKIVREVEAEIAQVNLQIDLE